MRMELREIELENFKGIKHFRCSFEDQTRISAENGVGKTTIYDAFLWLLFDKDSTGRSSFGVRPWDKNNDPIKGLVVSVKAKIVIDGDAYEVKKTNTEKIVKRTQEVAGYESAYWIDGVPKPQGKYKLSVAEWVGDDFFKKLTNLRHVNALHWSERRDLLLSIVGEIGDPEGFEELTGRLTKRTIDEHKKVLQDEKKLHVKKRDGINPRIDELQRGLSEYAGDTKKDLEKKRGHLNDEIKKLNVSRETISGDEEKRQKRLQSLNNLNAKKAERESALKTDDTIVRPLITEKVKIEQAIGILKVELSKAVSAYEVHESKVDAMKKRLGNGMRERTLAQEDYKTIEQENQSEICPTCKQKLPAERLAELADNRESRSQEIVKRGNAVQAGIDKLSAEIEEAGTELSRLKSVVDKIATEIESANEAQKVRYAEIDKLIEDSREVVDPSKDAEWMLICKAIESAEREIGESPLKKLTSISDQERELNQEVATINEELAQADRAKQDKKRIKELGQQEKDLSQAIADIDRQIEEIGRYKMAESKMITDAVNDKFNKVEWKLFNIKLNGNIEECCTCLLNGVPYDDMSYGQKIITGADIVNTISHHYDIYCPMFIDNAESLTYGIENDTQIIRLVAVEGQKSLLVS